MKTNFAILLLSFSIISGCNTPTSNVRIHAKVGDSCVLEHHCKITVRFWQGSYSSGGNVYYRCLVSDDFYNITSLEELVVMDITKCERISP